MKEDCLFGLEHLFCALAGNGDENEMFWFHIDRMFYLKTIFVNLDVNFCQFEDTFCWFGRMRWAHWQPKNNIKVIGGQNKTTDNRRIYDSDI